MNCKIRKMFGAHPTSYPTSREKKYKYDIYDIIIKKIGKK